MGLNMPALHQFLNLTIHDPPGTLWALPPKQSQLYWPGSQIWATTIPHLTNSCHTHADCLASSTLIPNAPHSCWIPQSTFIFFKINKLSDNGDGDDKCLPCFRPIVSTIGTKIQCCSADLVRSHACPLRSTSWHYPVHTWFHFCSFWCCKCAWWA